MSDISKEIFLKKPPNQHFRLGVLTFNLAHIKAAGFFVVHVGHNSFRQITVSDHIYSTKLEQKIIRLENGGKINKEENKFFAEA